MQKLFLVTSNKHKFLEMSQILKEFGIELKQFSTQIFEPDFDSLEEVAKEKARQAFAKLEKPVLVEDTGVFFEAFNNFPGALAKRVFLGIGFVGLCTLIKSAENRKAFFKTAVCYFDGKKMKTFTGLLEGKLLEEPVSIEKDRLPYEKIFVPARFTKALVDLSIEEKNKISHRSIATRKFGEWFAKTSKFR